MRIRSRDWLVGAIVSLAMFTLMQGSVVFGGWWYQDAPFPAQALAQRFSDSVVVPGQWEGLPVTEALEAELLIPSLGVRIPIVWSQSRREEDLQRDLDQGAIHYPGTAPPGAVGNAFISAHSSDYLWEPGEYKTAFARLGDLNVGDSDIFIEYRQNDRVVRRFAFRVKEKAVVTATDERLFVHGEQPEMTLVTCWPIGTSWRRLMVKTELIGGDSL